ncbi:MAG: Hint domain-containing protein, partial [Pseudomonadota bacterium]
MATLYFAGNQVALFDSIDDESGQTSFETTFVFEPDDVVEIEIRDSDINSNGEFDPNEVIYESITVVRDGARHEFTIDSGSKIKESGGGGAKEQGDTFFTTNDVPNPPSSGPFAGLSSDNWVFALDDTFTAGESTSITRDQDQDLNGDGDTSDSGESGNSNFNATRAQNPPVCYCPGALILTNRGEVPVEDLRVGDLLVTADHGLQPLVWIGVSRHRFG